MLGAKIEKPAAANEVEVQPKKTTSAPPPVKPVGAKAPPGKKPGFYEGMPLKEYNAWRRSQGARR